MGFSRQEYWSRLPFPSLGDLPKPGIEPGSPAWQAGSLPTELGGKPRLYSRNSIILLPLVAHKKVWKVKYEVANSGRQYYRYLKGYIFNLHILYFLKSSYIYI